MPQTRVNFANQNNWNLIDSGSRTAAIATNSNGTTAIVPISAINLPLVIENNTIAVLFRTNNRKPTWYTGGWISFNILTGLTVGGSFDSSILRRRVTLDLINIISAPSIAQTFSLTIQPPYYFPDFSWTIWEYIGDGKADMQGKLDLIADFI